MSLLAISLIMLSMWGLEAGVRYRHGLWRLLRHKHHVDTPPAPATTDAGQTKEAQVDDAQVSDALITDTGYSDTAHDDLMAAGSEVAEARLAAQRFSGDVPAAAYRTAMAELAAADAALHPMVVPRDIST